MKNHELTIQNSCINFVPKIDSILGKTTGKASGNINYCDRCKLEGLEICKKSRMDYCVGFLNEKDPIILYQGPDKELANSFYNRQFDFASILSVSSEAVSKYSKNNKFVLSGSMLDTNQKALEIISLITKMLSVKGFKWFLYGLKAILNITDIAVGKNIKGVIPKMCEIDSMSKYNCCIKFNSQNKWNWEISFIPTQRSSSNISYTITPNHEIDSEALSKLVELLNLFWKSYQNKDDFDTNCIFINRLFVYAYEFKITKHQNN